MQSTKHSTMATQVIVDILTLAVDIIPITILSITMMQMFTIVISLHIPILGTTLPLATYLSYPSKAMRSYLLLKILN